MPRVEAPDIFRRIVSPFQNRNDFRLADAQMVTRSRSEMGMRKSIVLSTDFLQNLRNAKCLMNIPADSSGGQLTASRAERKTNLGPLVAVKPYTGQILDARRS